MARDPVTGRFISGGGKQVLAARGRRGGVAARKAVNVEWFIDDVSNKIALTMRQRVTMATSLLKSKVVQNISRPVTKGKGPRGGNIVTNRSKPGEFPKAETTLLMKGIFGTVKQVRKGMYDGYVGTPLSYGVILELSKRLNRSFLVRSLREEAPKIKALLSGPIKG